MLFILKLILFYFIHMFFDECVFNDNDVVQFSQKLCPSSCLSSNLLNGNNDILLQVVSTLSLNIAMRR